ncbi:MAG: hypothetical protein AMK72_11780 [Planctomycetes bacterium SM23_25]|nr:MAG: hypothetical protein AMK72_11780 [Planctomycetes bacterium SM23_25]
MYDDAEAALTSVASGQAPVRQRVSAYLGLAFLYGKTGRNDSASRCYQQAMDLDDGVAEVLMQVERRGFVPSPVADPHGRIRSRRRISQGELERIIRDSRRQGQP